MRGKSERGGGGWGVNLSDDASAGDQTGRLCPIADYYSTALCTVVLGMVIPTYKKMGGTSVKYRSTQASVIFASVQETRLKQERLGGRVFCGLLESAKRASRRKRFDPIVRIRYWSTTWWIDLNFTVVGD